MIDFFSNVGASALGTLIVVGIVFTIFYIAEKSGGGL